jgi:ornithine--oxo-acid transaminase
MDRYKVYARHLNGRMVQVLRATGYDIGFRRGAGQDLFDREDNRRVELLSGCGVFAIGRNHPTLRGSCRSVLEADLPKLVQLDVSPLCRPGGS